MKRIIVTPTFRPHFPFNREFLESYAQHVEDAREVAVHFIATRDEMADLREVLREFPQLDLHLHAFEDFLEASGHREDLTSLLGELGKFTYQSLKKLYALKALPYDQALVLDSESLVLKPVRMNAVFDAYFADPYVLYSDMSHRVGHWFGGLSDAATRNAATLLGIPYPDMYFMEYYGWFYEKRIIDDVFAAFPEDLLPAIRQRLRTDRRVFENVLIYSRVLMQPAKYPEYRFVAVNTLLRDYLGDEGYAEYMRHFAGEAEQIGIFEYVSKALNMRNMPALVRLFNEREFRFYRFELLNSNEEEQRALIEQTPITFLTSSENYRRMRERIAVCLSGEARAPHQNLKFLRSFLADSGADVFFHFWETSARDLITRSLAPKGFAFESTDAAPEPPRAARPEKFITPERDRRGTAMLYSIARANELKQDYERAHGFRYDIVVRARMDFFSVTSLVEIIHRIRAEQRGWDSTLYVPDRAHSVGLNDQLALGTSATMDLYASAYAGLAAFAQHSLLNFEYYLLRHVQSKGLRIRTFVYEYVLLRHEGVATFDLERLIHDSRTTWWSRALPPVPPSGLDAYFRAKGDSVSLIDELALETPKAFRLRTGAGGYVTVDSASGAIGSAQESARASLFVVTIADSQDRTAVNIRVRDAFLRGQPGGAGLDVAGGDSLGDGAVVPDASGRVHARGALDPYAAFFVGREEGGLTFEWRPGFWKRIADERHEAPRVAARAVLPVGEEVRAGDRLYLTARPDGVVVAPRSGPNTAFQLEYVRDADVEAVSIDVKRAVEALPVAKGAPVSLLLYRTYRAVRIAEQHGAAELFSETTRYVRRRFHLARRASGSRPSGPVGRIMRWIGRRM